MEALQKAETVSAGTGIPFAEWPLDLLMEHENEGNRYLHIRELTGGFQAPADACGSYRLMMTELEAFVNALFEHIHLENNIIFPKFMELEGKWVG